MITVVCSECGGTGILKYINKYWDWVEKSCEECGGKGTVQELSFKERKERNSEN